MSFGPLFIQPTNSFAIRLGGKSLQEIQEIQEITFEIGMLGKYGLDINDSQESHVLGRCGEDILGAGAHLRNVRWLQENRAGDGNYAGSSPPTFSTT